MLEEEVRKKLEPVINQSIQKFLGITISELTEDITAKLQQPLLGIVINFNLNYKDAKKDFKKKYVERILLLRYGNVSLAADCLGVDRRTIHRIIEELGVDINLIRKQLLKPSYIREKSVKSAIEESLREFESVIHPIKLKEMYQNVEEISKNVLQELPENPLTLKEAENEFEKTYLKQKLKEFNNNTSKCAKAIGLRYETLHRKIKELKI